MTSSSLPNLDEFGYQPIRFLETDSKMSSILLVADAQQQLLILKIAKVDQGIRADVNRDAIHNTVKWCAELGENPGIAKLYPIPSTSKSESNYTYLARLTEWAGAPEFLAMEYLEGGSLADLVGRKRLPIEWALQIAHGISLSLDFIHGRDCVHRDLKPENILFRNTPSRKAFTDSSEKGGNTPMPILIDFGVAARKGDNRNVSGSRLWMSPELQMAYERHPLPVDPAWDIYALGLLLCYMLTGLRPQRRNYDYASYQLYEQHTVTLLETITNKRANLDPTILPRLQQLLHQTLAKEPSARPTAGEFIKQSAEILASLETPLPNTASGWRQIEQARLQHVTSHKIMRMPYNRVIISLLVILSILIVIVLLQNNQRDAISHSDPQATQTPNSRSTDPTSLHPPQKITEPNSLSASTKAVSPAVFSDTTEHFSDTPKSIPPTLVQPTANHNAPTLVPAQATNRPLAPTLFPGDH